MTRIAASLLLLTALVACGASTDGADPLAEAAPQDGALITPIPSPQEQEGRPGAGRSERRKGSARRDGTGSEPDREARSGGSGGGSRASAPSRRPVGLPAPGTYAYAQKGWEEVCQAGACDRSALPSEQRLVLEHGGDGATFGTTARGAGAREQSITYSLRRDRLLIARIENDFSYGAFRTRSEIVPDPPIVTARLPFRSGDSWDGEWTDRNGEVHGRYDFRVRRREKVGQEDAFVVVVNMTFRGTYRGSSEMRLWIDPGLTILASQRKDVITGDFGTYRTDATTSLVRRP